MPLPRPPPLRSRAGRVGRSTALPLLLDAGRAYQAGPAAVQARQCARLADMVTFARSRSPTTAGTCTPGCRSASRTPRCLPVTGECELMARFDDAITDQRATRAAVAAFVADPSLIGQPLLHGYTVTTTSGTRAFGDSSSISGTRGVEVTLPRRRSATSVPGGKYRPVQSLRWPVAQRSWPAGTGHANADTCRAVAERPEGRRLGPSGCRGHRPCITSLHADESAGGCCLDHSGGQ